MLCARHGGGSSAKDRKKNKNKNPTWKCKINSRSDCGEKKKKSRVGEIRNVQVEGGVKILTSRSRERPKKSENILKTKYTLFV